ncbi:DUF927 domain-containing protein [Salinisphaera orenii]|uniref:DUF927 domain-containing protein n=1 Tax=Salinisphaera orenii TaxID=856731 RepID=UPI000DBE0354
MNFSDNPSAVDRTVAQIDKQLVTPVQNDRDIRDKRDPLRRNGSAVPEQPGQDRDPTPHFELIEEGDAPGVYWVDVTRDKDGTITGQAAPVWICSPLKVVAMTRDAANGEWGRLLVFSDADGGVHRWTCPQSMHAGNGDELRAVLLREGLTITTNAKNRRLVGDYIQQARPETRARCVDRTGWHGDVFALPRETFGDAESEPVLFQAESIDGVDLGQAGTLNGWINNVAALCAGNSRMVLAICAGFAGPCAGLLKVEGGGLHLRGSSSTGKSTALQVAASLYGSPEGFARSWRATDNGLEGIAALHSDLLLVLDEIGQLDPKHAGQVAYMLANGQGKTRSHRDGSPRATLKWRVLFLSAGEVSLADLVTQSGGQVRAGQEVRVIDLPADADRGLGLFDTHPASTTAASYADRMKAEAGKHYGHALPAFLRALVEDPETAREQLQQLRAKTAGAITPADAAGQVRRVADRFALLAAAGELATTYDLTGWESGEAIRAAESCFNAWLAARGTPGNSENAAMLAQVRAFLESHGESRFTRWDAPNEGVRTTFSRAGFRKQGESGPIYYVERECFRKEICKGFDHRAVAQVLEDRGALLAGSQKETTRKEWLPDHRRTRVYVITPELWEDAA